MSPSDYLICWMLTLPIRVILFAFKQPARFLIVWLGISLFGYAARALFLHPH